MDKDKKFCSLCAKNVEPDYVSRSCIAQYGSVVFCKGYCPNCGSIIVKDHMIDDEGLQPPKRGW